MQPATNSAAARMLLTAGLDAERDPAQPADRVVVAGLLALALGRPRRGGGGQRRGDGTGRRQIRG